MSIIKRLTISLPVNVHESIMKLSEVEHRSINNWIEHRIITQVNRPHDAPVEDLQIRFAGSDLNPADVEACLDCGAHETKGIE